MLSDGCRLLARIADLLSHTYFTEHMLISPDRARVPRTDNPAAIPLNSDRYYVMSRGSPSSGPLPVSSISSSDVAITQLWYPTPNRTYPSVDTIRSCGSGVSNPLGVYRVGILPTKRWTCFVSARMQLPMMDVYVYVLSGVDCASVYFFTSSWCTLSMYLALCSSVK
jgi:hypothetical protein